MVSDKQLKEWAATFDIAKAPGIGSQAEHDSFCRGAHEAVSALVEEVQRLKERQRYREGEIRLNKAGELDEVVASDLDFFHMEQMDEGSWWLSLTLRGGGNITVWLNTKRPSRTKILARAERS